MAKGTDLGVALPDVQSDEETTLQAQNAQAEAVIGDGGDDTVTQDITV